MGLVQDPVLYLTHSRETQATPGSRKGLLHIEVAKMYLAGSTEARKKQTNLF